jgi:hypothetical protein
MEEENGTVKLVSFSRCLFLFFFSIFPLACVVPSQAMQCRAVFFPVAESEFQARRDISGGSGSGQDIKKYFCLSTKYESMADQ